MSNRLALLLVAVAGVGVVAFFVLARRKAPTDPILAGIQGLTGGVTGFLSTIAGTVKSVVDVPVRVADDAIGVAEDVISAPVNLVKKLWPF
jgi:hypothetical protein